MPRSRRSVLLLLVLPLLLGTVAFSRASGAAHPSGAPVGFAATPSGRGYWVVDAAGHGRSFGNARPHGDAPPGLRQPVVAIAASRSGRGYWLVAADGGVFSFGDA